MPVAEWDHITIAYDDVGPADAEQAVVLIHGFASSRTETWRRMGWLGAFERRRLRALALDVRGHGDSAKPHAEEDYGAPRLIGDILAVMNAADVRRVALMGYSMGARLALAFAQACPERLRCLILGGVGGRLFDPSPAGYPMAQAMEAPDPAMIDDPLLRSFRQFADEQGADRLALAACSRARHGNINREALLGLRMPVLIVTGAFDGLAGSPDDLATAIPGARSITLPGCDHFSAIGHALYKAAVFDFLDELP